MKEKIETSQQNSQTGNLERRATATGMVGGEIIQAQEPSQDSDQMKMITVQPASSLSQNGEAPDMKFQQENEKKNISVTEAKTSSQPAAIHFGRFLT